jgi:addiction module RelE/StbE family toxin
MPRAYKTIFSRYAEDDLTEIIEYYRSVNPEYALKLLETMEARINELKNYPERGRIVPELEEQNIVDYRELIESSYRIIYAIQESIVIIYTIIDGRRNFEELIIGKLMRYYS